jgi:pimeloyl-ACP methyl ester carboxylesterase
MHLFRRVVRLILVLAGALAALIVAAATFFARQMIRPTRQPLWATPTDAGMAFEDVTFPARDGLRLSGWFLPAEGEEAKHPTVVLIHGWMWNRLGEAADNLMANLTGALPVDLLRVAHSLTRAEFNVLMFDLRNHGDSARGGPVTFGLQEANDVIGAVDYLRRRPDVSDDKIGLVGWSMGANAVLFALPHLEEISAAVAIQPTSLNVFAPRLAHDLLGPLGGPSLSLASLLYEQAGRLPLTAIEPLSAAPGVGGTPLLYVQGTGDQWGSVSNVAHLADRTPNAANPLFIDSYHRSDAYRYVVAHPEVIIEFLKRNL